MRSKPPVFEMRLETVRLWSFPVAAYALLDRLLFRRVAADLGAGDCTGAFQLLRHGAKKVFVVDKTAFNLSNRLGDRAVKVTAYFDDWTPPEECKVALISWPINHEQAVHHLLRMVPSFETVIYVGKNTDGTACATKRWFNEMQYYPVHCFVEDRRDTLIVYDTRQRLDFPRPPCCEEELAGLTGIWTTYGAMQPPSVQEA